MRYVLLGGSGLIGSALADELVAAGYQVTIVSRSPEKARTRPGVAAVGWDGRSAQGWGHTVDGAAGVINLAGESIGGGLWTAARKQRIVHSRLNAGAAIVEAVRQAREKPAVVFQISGVGYYGVSAQKTFIEADAPGSDFLAQVARQWEAATQPVETLGVRRVVARCGIVLSGRGGVLANFMLPFRLFIGGPLGSGQQWISWVHIRDQVRAIRFLLERAECAGVYNLAAPQSVTNAQFGKALGRVMRRPYWMPAPGFALRLALGEMSTVVLDGQRASPRRLQEAGFQFEFAELEGGLRDLLSRR